MSIDHFKPAWWLNNPHLQTIWPAIFRPPIRKLELKRERVELPDGDFIDLDWAGKDKSGPIVLVLHGFEGSIHSHYAKGMLKSMCDNGWRGVFMHFRGCSGEPNRLTRGYHSGSTEDVAYIVEKIREHEPDTPIAAIGYSIGGNMLLKWLGETKQANPLNAAVAVSVPYDLNKVAKRVQQGFSRFYQWYLLKCVCDRLLCKPYLLPPPIDMRELEEVNTVSDFDDKYTVPIHGFRSVEDYYKQTSSRQYLKFITVPTLLVHAKDDPFMTEDVIPETHDLSPAITLEVTETGGHVGFVSGTYPWAPTFWLEERVPAFFRKHW